MKTEPSHETDSEVLPKIDYIFYKTDTHYHVRWQEGPNGEKYKNTREPKTIASAEEIQRWEVKKAENARSTAQWLAEQAAKPKQLSPDPTARKRLIEQRIKEAAEAPARAPSPSPDPLKVEIKVKEDTSSRATTLIDTAASIKLQHHDETLKVEPIRDDFTRTRFVPFKAPDAQPTTPPKRERVSPSIQSTKRVKVEEDCEVSFVAVVKRDSGTPPTFGRGIRQSLRVHTLEPTPPIIDDDTDVQITHIVPVKKDRSACGGRSTLASYAARTRSASPRPQVIKIEADKAALQQQVQDMEAELQGAKRKLKDMEDE